MNETFNERYISDIRLPRLGPVKICLLEDLPLVLTSGCYSGQASTAHSTGMLSCCIYATTYILLHIMFKT